MSSLHKPLKSRDGVAIQPVMLVILDGFGLAKASKWNAVTSARARTIKRFFSEYPWLRLDPSGEAVGLPRHQMGTSEVGHLNLGAGRVVDQALVRVDKAIKDGTFYSNKALVGAVEAAKKPGAALHLLGLCSDGGVHSSLEHLFALLELARRHEVKHLFLHALTDGRDTEARVAKTYLRAIQQRCTKLGVGEIATVGGRYYGMDRDSRWDREKKAYDALVSDVGPRFKTAVAAVDAAYARGEGDEFITPSIIETKDARTSKIIDGDSVIFFNFRQDRARQLSHGFTDEHFTAFAREKVNVRFTTMTSYEKTLKARVAFPPETVENGLAEWLSRNKVRQFHAAETEKYAHVTYFFNGGREQVFRGEERALVPSPRIATYDLKPEMSAAGVLSNAVNALRAGRYGFIVVNFANTDMVGHTGKLEAAVKAVETVDGCLSRLETEAAAHGYVLLVTADHGNVEEMHGVHATSHTLNDVPFFILDPLHRYAANKSVGKARLGDVATTVLAIMGLRAPKEMTGRVLVVKKE